MMNKTSVAIGAVDNPLNFVWVSNLDDLDLDQIAKQLGVEEIMMVDCEGPFYRVLREVSLLDLSRVYDVLCDGYDYGLHEYMEYLGINYSLTNLDSVAQECEDAFQGVYASFEAFAEEQLESMEVPDWLWPYLDVEKYARDLQQEFHHTATEVGVIVWGSR